MVSQDRHHLFGDPLLHTDSRDSTGRQILNCALQAPSGASLCDGASSTFGGAPTSAPLFDGNAPPALCLMVLAPSAPLSDGIAPTAPLSGGAVPPALLSVHTAPAPLSNGTAHSVLYLLVQLLHLYLMVQHLMHIFL